MSHCKFEREFHPLLLTYASHCSLSSSEAAAASCFHLASTSDFAELLNREGLAHCIDWHKHTSIGPAEALKIALSLEQPGPQG